MTKIVLRVDLGEGNGGASSWVWAGRMIAVLKERWPAEWFAASNVTAKPHQLVVDGEVKNAVSEAGGFVTFEGHTPPLVMGDHREYWERMSDLIQAAPPLAD